MNDERFAHHERKEDVNEEKDTPIAPDESVEGALNDLAVPSVTGEPDPGH